MSTQVLYVTDADFEQSVLQAQLPVLVDFWAEWCGPCKMIGPIIEEIAAEYAGKLIVAKMDVDANNETPTQYGVRSIPTLLIFKNGEVIANKIGALSKSQLKVFIDTTI